MHFFFLIYYLQQLTDRADLKSVEKYTTQQKHKIKRIYSARPRVTFYYLRLIIHRRDEVLRKKK